MKAMLIRRYGAPDVFELGEIETPRPGRGEVLVRVRGSSVNPVDCAIRSGTLKWIVRLRFPAVLGVDVAGEVVEQGEGARRLAIDDRVFGYTGLRLGGGGYGEFAVLPETHLARVPSVLNWAEAGTSPVWAPPPTRHSRCTRHFGRACACSSMAGQEVLGPMRFKSRKRLVPM
jgi:NADPH:quinone reductase-like Zn-dependent oxidoreductase